MRGDFSARIVTALMLTVLSALLSASLSRGEAGDAFLERSSSDSLLTPAVRMAGQAPPELRRELESKLDALLLGPRPSLRAFGDELTRWGDSMLEAGYLGATLRLISPSRTEEGAELTIDAGPRARWDTLFVHLADLPDSLRAHEELGGDRPRSPSRSEPFDAARLEQSIWSWVDGWTEAGYPFATARVESVSVRNGEVHAGIRLDPGSRELVRELTLEGARSTRPAFARRWLRFRPGEPFRQSRLVDRGLRLEQTNLFQRVDGPRLERLREGGLRVVYPVAEVPQNRAEGVLGYSAVNRTVTGLAAIELGNLGGAGRAVGVRWSRPRPKESRFRLDYRELLLPRLPVGGSFGLEQEVRDSTYSQLIWEGTIDAPVSWDWTVSGGLEYRRASLGAEPAEQHRRLSSVVGAHWSALHLSEWRGGQAEVTVRSGRDRVRAPDGSSAGSERRNRADLNAELLRRVRGNFAARLHLLAGAVTGGDSLPASEIYRLGGSADLRGHPEEAFPARRYGVGQLEAGSLLSNGGWAYLFVDAGAIRGPEASASTSWKWGYGVGIAPRLGARSVALDLGFPGAPRFSEARIHLRFASRF